jgi:cellulose synthase/poly-beta-1,6-N-acetylglucosamine synthase-like glycosyltransferase
LQLQFLTNLYNWRSAAAFTLVIIPLAILAEWTWRRLRVLPAAEPQRELPALSIIVPARNEATNLAQLLPMITALQYGGPYEVIVMDDNSTDGTAEVAASHGAKVISLDTLPSGWRGKPHACHLGSLEAAGEWLLFVDADTLHAPDGPARAVQLALEEGLDGLSLLPPVRYFGYADRLGLTAAFAGLFAMGAPTAGMLNGQFVLLRREVYEQSGGFAAVRAEALEDVALGHRLAAQGYDVPMVRGDDAMQVSMYADVRQMWHGLTRLGQGALRWWGLRALLTAAFITALVSPLIAVSGFALGDLPWSWPVVFWTVAAVCMIPWARRAGHVTDAALSPLGGVMILLAAVWGVISRALGIGIQWKGRRV